MAKTAAKRLKFSPVNDRVLIRPDATDSVTPGGIVLPDRVVERPQFGTIVAVGPGRPLYNVPAAKETARGERYPMVVKEGDRVAFSSYTEKITIEDEEFVLVREDDLYGVFG